MDNGKTFYLPHSCDFRGRIYSNSLLSPIYNKLLRPAICFGEDLNESSYLFAFKKIKCSEYFKQINTFLKINTIQEYLKFCIHLEIGKQKIKEMVSIETPYVHVSKIIEMGSYFIERHKRLEESLNEFSSNDRLYIKILANCLEVIDSNRFPSYIPCLLDATASGQQVLAIVCDVQDENILKAFNLSNNHEWTDTYLFNIKKYREHLTKKNDLVKLNVLDTYFTRKVVKRPIMTTLYNAAPNTTINSMVDDLKETVSVQTLKTLRPHFNDFHIYIANTTIKENYGIDSLLDVNFSKNMSADINYYKTLYMKESRSKFTFNKKLKTVSYNYEETKLIFICTEDSLLPLNDSLLIKIFGRDQFVKYTISPDTNFVFNNREFAMSKPKKMFLGAFSLMVCELREIDVKKTDRARAANTAHYLDSDLVTHVLRFDNQKTYTIHDMYITSVLNKHNIYSRINIFFSTRLRKELFSLTVVI